MRLAQELLALASLLTEAALFLRGLKLRLFSKFPKLYSYIAYVLLTSGIGLVLYFVHPAYYAQAFWLMFTSYLLAEFAILAEIADHLFSPFPSIRYIGRAMIIAGTLISAIYVFAMFYEARPSDLAILEFARRMLLAKFFVIVLFMLPALYYRIPINSVVQGVIGGFCFFISIGILNFGGRETLGMTFSPIFSIIGQSSFIAMLLIWTRALWNPSEVRLARHPYIKKAAGAQPGHWPTMMSKSESC